MQIPAASKNPFNRKNVEDILKRENKFITALLSILPFPTSVSNDDDVLLQTTGDTRERPKLSGKQTSRAQSLVELQQRINQMTSKKGLTYKEKLLKKNLKAKLKKKDKKKKFSHKIKNLQTSETNTNTENVKIDPNTKGSESIESDKMDFSRIEFGNIGQQKKKKGKKDAVHLLEDIRAQKTKLAKLREGGDLEQAGKIKEKQAWKNALARAQGEKVKDDEQLLVKSIKKNVQKKKQSKKKWDSRLDHVQKGQEDRQKKRQDNLDKRKKTKKVNKIKKAVKRGKVIPGY